MTERALRATLSGLRSPRAQSHTVGVILLTAVIIILVGLVSLFVLSNVDTTPEPVADVEVEVTSSTVILTHAGGDQLPTEDVRVVFGRDGSAEASLSSFTELEGNGDGVFEGSERRRAPHSAAAVISVTVVHEPTNTVLAQEFLDVPGTTPTATTSSRRSPIRSLSTEARPTRYPA